MNTNFISGTVKIQLVYCGTKDSWNLSVAENGCIALYCLRDHTQELWPPVWGVQKYYVMGHELRELVDLTKEYSTNTMAIHLQLQVN